LKIVGTKKTTVLYMGDRWKPDELWDSRYIWMPLEIGGGKMRLPEPKPFHINVHTGEVQLEKREAVGLTNPALGTISDFV